MNVTKVLYIKINMLKVRASFSNNNNTSPFNCSLLVGGKTKAKKGDAQGQGKGQSQYEGKAKSSNPFVCSGYCRYI